MSPEEIIKRNESIAKFMGWEFSETFEGLLPNHWIDKTGKLMGSYHDTELKFQYSWDWIMPVVIKISHDFGSVKILVGNTGTAVNINDSLEGYDYDPIEAVFIAVSNYCMYAKTTNP